MRHRVATRDPATRGFVVLARRWVVIARTMLPSAELAGRIWLAGAAAPGRWGNTKDDLDPVAVDLDPPDERPDEVPPPVPVETVEAIPDARREVLEPTDDQGQLPFGLDRLGRGPPSRLETRDAGLELGAVEHALGVAVDQPTDAAAQGGDPPVELPDLVRFGGRATGRVQAPAVFLRHAIGPLQESADSVPDGPLEAVAPHGPVVANGGTAEAASVGAGATVVAVLAPRGVPLRPRGRLAVVGVAAAPADRQALQQPARAAPAVPLAPAVLAQLRLDGLEHGRVDQRRHGHLDPPLPRHDDPRGRPRRRPWMAADRAQPRPGRQEARVAVDGSADVGRVGQHAADRGGVPPRRAPAGRAAGALQAPADLAQAQAFQADPGEHQPDGRRLLGDDLEPGHATTLVLGDVAVAEGRGRERADQAGACRMAPAPTAPLQDPGALVLGDHALDLEQEVVLGGAADRAVEEHDLGAGAAELLHQEHLVGVTARQPVGGVDVEPLDVTGGHGVTQPLQGWAQQARAAVALVDVGAVGLDLTAVGGDVLAQRGDRAGDRGVARLLLGRDARVEGDVAINHAHLRAGLPPRLPAAGRSARPSRSCAGSAPGGCRRRSGIAERAGWSRTIPGPPRGEGPCAGPWAPPSAAAPRSGLRWALNWPPVRPFRPRLRRSSRSITDDHSKPTLATLYGRESSGPSVACSATAACASTTRRAPPAHGT